MLQDYLDREPKPAEPVLQETFDMCSRVLGFVGEVSDSVLADRPNLAQCVELLATMKDALMPVPDFHERTALSLDDIVAWRNRLESGFGTLGLANLLWAADVYGFPQYDFVRLERKGA